MCVGGGGGRRHWQQSERSRERNAPRVKDARDNGTGLFPPPPPLLRIVMNAAAAVARRMPSVARRGARWVARCQALLFGVSALVIVAERSARKWAQNCTRRRSDGSPMRAEFQQSKNRAVGLLRAWTRVHVHLRVCVCVWRILVGCFDE